MSGIIDKRLEDWYEESERDRVNMFECCMRGKTDEVRAYLESSVDVNEADEDGVTALQIAAAKGHRNIVELLLRSNASVDLKNSAGMSPFLHACREGHADIVTVLINHRANINLRTYEICIIFYLTSFPVALVCLH